MRLPTRRESASASPTCRRSHWRCRRTAPSAISPRRSRSSWRGRCARRRARSRRSWRPRRVDPGRHASRRRAERLPQSFPRPSGVSARRGLRNEIAARLARARQDHRRAHGDQSEQGGAHRPPAQRGARRHARARRCASAARRSKCRTTSTTPACRSPTSSSASASSSTSTSPTSAHRRDTTRFDYYCWDLYARVTEWYDGDKERLTIRARDAARHRARRQRRPPSSRAFIADTHRPRAPEDDGAAEHRLRPADVGRRHPAPASSGRTRSTS